MSGPIPSRYEGRKKVGDPRGFGVWDSFTQEWVVGEAHDTILSAVSAAGRLNRAYERAMA
jgi:hypothetical protein